MTPQSTQLLDSMKIDQPIIEFSGVHKWYGDFEVLHNINLSVRPASAS
ncbi:hypothetical protein CAter10_0439 [Collimonas arenae]|nr:hypothetical protein CAter10_0439 [Collimonas arenae]